MEIALKEFPKLSNVELARICAVNDKTVAAARPNLGSSEVRTGADGKERKMPAKTPGMKALEAMGATIVDMRKPAEPEPSKPAPREIVMTWPPVRGG